MTTKISKEKHKMFVDITNLNQKRDYLDQISKDKATYQEYQSNWLFDAIFRCYEDVYFASQKGYLNIHKHTIISE